jgi:FAD/FMN-containing dehydrogenase
MSPRPTEWEQALDRVRETLGPDRMLESSQATEEIRRRSLNPADERATSCLVRPRSTEECRIAIAELAAVGCRPRPIGGLTTFWEPETFDVEVGLDTLGLRAPERIDVAERVGCFGAGLTVREVDRMARAQGLCLVAYPDSDGSASVGSMAAVACTSGLGMARLAPVEQIVGLTVVTPDATVLRTGASWRLGHGGIAHGMPDPTGMFLGAQGRFGVITEVVLTLMPAPWLAARSWVEPWRPADALAEALRRARDEIDRGIVDSLRLETVSAGATQPTTMEWFARCWSPESAASADEHSAAVARRLGARDARAWVESVAARRGDEPDHDTRYSLPPGSHHTRTGQAGFLGVEVNVNWGTQLDAALAVFAELLRTVGTLPLGYLRLGIYPAPHTVSVGAQAMVSNGTATADAVREALARFVEPLAALGALPYRPGRSWKAITDRRESGDPACALMRRAGLT